MINLSLEVVHALDSRHLRITTCSDSGDEAIEAAVRRVINYPPALIILRRAMHFEIEPGLVLEAIALPQLTDLGQDFTLVGVTSLPLNRRMEAIHCGMKLEAGRVIYPL